MAAVDHYCGTEARIRKALALQAELIEETGACVMDVTLDCEDGAPSGQELEHAELMVALLHETATSDRTKPLRVPRRVGLRVHPVDHEHFYSDLQIVLPQAGRLLSHIMLPKTETLADVERAVDVLNQFQADDLPLHCLIESAQAVQNAPAIAAHPRVDSLSFGLMDFVSSHNGAIPQCAMTMDATGGQFDHPLVVKAKIDIAAACHATGKVPSHCVVTEFSDAAAIQSAAEQAAQRLGYTRMWSIHPAQVRAILNAFAPNPAQIDAACEVLLAASAVDWAPISISKKLHDRASYRYYWQLLQRAQQIGAALPEAAKHAFFSANATY